MALVNKMVRIAWALLVRGTAYEKNHVSMQSRSRPSTGYLTNTNIHLDLSGQGAGLSFRVFLQELLVQLDS